MSSSRSGTTLASLTYAGPPLANGETYTSQFVNVSEFGTLNIHVSSDVSTVVEIFWKNGNQTDVTSGGTASLNPAVDPKGSIFSFPVSGTSFNYVITSEGNQTSVLVSAFASFYPFVFSSDDMSSSSSPPTPSSERIADLSLGAGRLLNNSTNAVTTPIVDVSTFSSLTVFVNRFAPSSSDSTPSYTAETSFFEDDFDNPGNLVEVSRMFLQFDPNVVIGNERFAGQTQTVPVNGSHCQIRYETNGTSNFTRGTGLVWGNTGIIPASGQINLPFNQN